MKSNYDQKVYAARMELSKLGRDIYNIDSEIWHSLSLLEAEIRFAKMRRS